MTVQTGACRWRLGGRPHPIQRGAWGPIVGHVRLLAVARVRLSSLTETDAERCGCSSLRSFRDAWRQQHGRWDGALEVVAIRFTLTDKPPRYRQENLLTKLEGRPDQEGAPTSERQ